ncbi:putative protein kinase RLK-Pelle-CrRLK1L-1 family [Helianthus annuus]|nr:putative protein kinase RLK-Pelle-CrRLK1L-1 family [Helianthus annuus]
MLHYFFLKSTKIMDTVTGESSSLAQLCYRFSLEDIQSATNNFDDTLVIGHGGFGKVYKGCVHTDETSQVVAVKRLDSMSNQGVPEFRAEIEMLSKLRHRHLVSLIGFCDDNKEMILVYEYMPHGTLYDHLHKDRTPLSWVQRVKIAMGAARGLDYLHTGTLHGVIHRDVKSSNILLDENWEAMISDFGLSKIGSTNQLVSYVDASVKGTFGYLDPEYFYTNKLTRKTDVYAFGVVLFELLSGRLPVMLRRNIACAPKERPTMTEVVASLQALLELPDKSNHSEEASPGRCISILFPQQNQTQVYPNISLEHNGLIRIKVILQINEHVYVYRACIMITKVSELTS